MALEIISTAPSLAGFTPLSKHQEQTPSTFFGGEPILYFHTKGARLRVNHQRLRQQAAFAPFESSTTESNGNTQHVTISASPGAAADATIQDIDIFVTSQTLTIFSPSASHGIRIPYPSICMHAVNEDQVLINLVLFNDDQDSPETDTNTQQENNDDVEILEFYLVPVPDAATVLEQSTPIESTNNKETDAAALYEAIAKCSALNPEPKTDDDNDDDDEEQPQMAFGVSPGADIPGAGGWITAENMNEFVDENGEFKIPEVGAGAHEGEEVDDEDKPAKWRRTG